MSVNFYFIFYVKNEQFNNKKMCGLSGIVGGVWEATHEVVASGKLLSKVVKCLLNNNVLKFIILLLFLQIT